MAIPDTSQELGSRTAIRLGAVIAHPQANFSEVHTCLDMLMFYLVKDYELEPLSHGSFLDGRAGTILSQGQTVGLIGELHPEVLENWGISVPISVVEFDVDWLCSDSS